MDCQRTNEDVGGLGPGATERERDHNHGLICGVGALTARGKAPSRLARNKPLADRDGSRNDLRPLNYVRLNRLKQPPKERQPGCLGAGDAGGGVGLVRLPSEWEGVRVSQLLSEAVPKR